MNSFVQILVTMLKMFIVFAIVCFSKESISGMGWMNSNHLRHSDDRQMTIETGILTILAQPANQCDCKGNKAVFSVIADGGTGTLHYLWKRKRPGDADFAAFGAKDSTKLAVFNIGVGSDSPDGTLYQVTVSDQISLVTSSHAMLTVNQITGIAPTGIASFTLNQGDNLSLKVLTAGSLPYAFQWIKKFASSDWRDLTNNAIISGSQNAQLNFTGISAADSGIYKVRVTFPTLNGNQCIETSTITRKVNVIPAPDLEPPHFINLTDENREICMTDLAQASWNEAIADILPIRTDYHEIARNNILFNLSPAHFTDNVSSISALILHWGIFSGDVNGIPILDESGHLLEDQIGQISDYPENIRLRKSGTENGNFQIIFWLEDEAGNLTPENQKHKINLIVRERPQIVSNF